MWSFQVGGMRVPGKWLGALCLALASSIWGGMYVVSKIVLAVMPAVTLVWMRYVLALAALLAVGLATRQPWRIPWRHIPLIVAIGAVGYGLSIWAQFRGTQLTTAQMGSIVTSATPAFMVVFGRLILGEPVTWRRGISVCMATLGVLMIVGVERVSAGQLRGGLILLLAAISWALMSVLVKTLPSGYSSLVVTTYAIGVATLVLTPRVLLQGLYEPGLARPEIWGGIIFLGLISTAGAFVLWTRGLQLLDVGNGGLYFFFQPLVGTALGWFVLREAVSWTFWVGAALIVVGVLLVVREGQRTTRDRRWDKVYTVLRGFFGGGI